MFKVKNCFFLLNNKNEKKKHKYERLQTFVIDGMGTFFVCLTFVVVDVLLYYFPIQSREKSNRVFVYSYGRMLEEKNPIAYGSKCPSTYIHTYIRACKSIL